MHIKYHFLLGSEKFKVFSKYTGLLTVWICFLISKISQAFYLKNLQLGYLGSAPGAGGWLVSDTPQTTLQFLLSATLSGITLLLAV